MMKEIIARWSSMLVALLIWLIALFNLWLAKGAFDHTGAENYALMAVVIVGTPAACVAAAMLFLFRFIVDMKVFQERSFEAGAREYLRRGGSEVFIGVVFCLAVLGAIVATAAVIVPFNLA